MADDRRTPKVRISYDEMEAFLLLPAKDPGEKYTYQELTQALDKAGVRFGVDKKVLNEMVDNDIYSRDVLVAKGKRPEDGEDGYFTYNFDFEFSKKPKIREDGSVDYWSIHAVEVVEEGQIIATYTEPIPGENGMSVKGKLVSCKRGRPQPPLIGRGFNRSEDGLTYTAALAGKIEKQNNRIVILPVYEVNGNVDLNIGNIDFKGDVIVHGDVLPGAHIRCTGSITVDGVSEGCYYEAGKDIILRGGMIGGDKAVIKAKGNIIAKFIEYTTVEADGFIEADSAMNSTIVSYDRVYFMAGHASVVGGSVFGCAGIEARNFGNESEIKTEIHAGVHKKLRQRVASLEIAITQDKSLLNSINEGIAMFDKAGKEKGIDFSNDERRVSLMRTRISKQADVVTNTQELTRLNAIIDRSKGATVIANRVVYGGVEVSINDSTIKVKDMQKNVEFMERNDRVVMLSLV